MKNSGSAWIIIHSKYRGYILAKRSKLVKNSGQWGFFGGRIEENESPLEAAIREYQEEANVTQHDIQLKYELPAHTYPHLHMFHYYYASIPDSIKINEEHTEYRWFNIHQLIGLEEKLHGPAQQFLQRVILDPNSKPTIF